MLLLLTGGASYAQVKSKAEAKYTGLERWAFKTNAFGWLVTVPNLTAEFDLTPYHHNRSTLSLTAKYNWNTKHSLLPYYVFNYSQIRPEYRYYFRTENVDFLKKIVKNPKTIRANYFGVYADAGTYTFKLGKYGRQGYMYGAGFSFGYGLPMYEYRRGAIDVELGFSLGVMMATADIFVLNDSNPSEYEYDVIKEKSKPLHVIPSPVVSELSLTFAWRKASIKGKYSKINQARRMAKLARQDSIYAAKQAKEEAKLQAEEAKAKKKADALKAKELKAQEKLDKKNSKGKKGKDAANQEAVNEKKGKKDKVKEEKPKKEKPEKEKTEKEKKKKQKSKDAENR